MKDYDNFYRPPHRFTGPRPEPLSIFVPMWSEQYGTFQRLSVIAFCPPEPLITVCALAFIGSHKTREELLRNCGAAQRLYAWKGKNVQLPFHLERLSG